MAHYIYKQEDLVELSDSPLEIGYDKIDFDLGKYIEISEDYLEYAQALIESMTREPEYDEEGNEILFNRPTADDIFYSLFPKKYYYIKDKKIIELRNILNPQFYQIGQDYKDYLNNKYVLLSEEQIHYMLYNPEASIYLIYYLGELPEPKVPTLEEVKAKKLMELAMYDTSENVNSFTINNVLPAWFTPSERTNYALSVQSAKNFGVDTLTFAVGNNVLQVATEKAEMMLSAIQLYADNCYMITKQHELVINNLDNIEAIKQYDITTGYPEKLNFDLI